MTEEQIVVEDKTLSKEVDYSNVEELHGTYYHNTVPISESYSDTTITAGMLMTVNINTQDVFNLGESVLRLPVVFTAQAANTNLWMHGSCLPMFRSINFAPQGTKEITIDQYHHWSKMSTPYLLSREELKSRDLSEVIFPSRTFQSQNKLPANGFNASVPLEEMQYAIPIDGGVANTSKVYDMHIPLRNFIGTPLAMMQDIGYDGQMQLVFTFEDPDKWVWYNTNSSNDPNGGTPTAVTTKPKLQNPQFLLAYEKDQAIIDSVKMKKRNGQLEINFLCPKYYGIQIKTGEAQEFTIPSITNASGRKLVAMFSSPFYGAAAENLNKSLDNCNQAASPVTTNATNRVITYKSQWDGNDLQNKLIGASPNVQLATGTSYATTMGDLGDWDRYKQFFEGSCYFTSGTLGLNYCIIDDFTSRNNRMLKNLFDPNKIEGKNISDGNHNYIIQSTNANAQYNWYVFGLFLRKLVIGPQGVAII